MKYDIIAAHIKRVESGQYEVAVAWQANDDPRSWRVTYDAFYHIPHQVNILDTVKVGLSMAASQAKKLFPYLPKNCVED